MAEITTFDAPVYSAQGTTKSNQRLPETFFDGTVNVPVMHQAVKAFLANRRQGTAKTKTRGEVTGGNQKPWKQKGTGRARQGSIRAPNWPGGGKVFGPIPRAYTQIVPRQTRALARKSAFNARARENSVMIVEALDIKKPSTKVMLALFAKLGISDKKVLVLTDGVKPNVYLSTRNLQSAHVMPYTDASTYHVLWSDVVVIESAALSASTTTESDAPAKAPRAPRSSIKKSAATTTEA